MIPIKAYLTRGVGVHKEKLTSFEMALRQAGIAAYNLVSVSSIYPPRCQMIPRSKAERYLLPGQILHAVLARIETMEPSRLIAASVGIARPKDRSTHGYISEHHAFGQRSRVAGDFAEDLAATMLATTLGIKFNPDTAWDEREEEFRMSGKMVQTRAITQTAKGDARGWWTTAVAACVFLCEGDL